MSASPYNAAVDLLGRNLDGSGRARRYLITEERSFSYEEVAAASDAAGAGLLDLGLGAGDRVVLCLRDGLEFVAAFWGAMKAGLVPIPLAQGLASADLDFILADSEARATVCDLSSASALLPAAARAGIQTVFVGEGTPDGARAWSEICAGSARLEAAATDEDDVALWLYTSGTTGLPKAAMHRHRHLRFAPTALARQVIGLEPDDVVLSVSKMFFAYGLGNSVYLPAAAGASVIVHPGPAMPARVHALMSAQSPTLLFGVPAFFGAFSMMDDASLPASVRMVLSAGEALTPSLLERFRDRFGRPLVDGLGSTEALHHFTCNDPNEVVPGSAGRALEGYAIRARDRDGNDVPEGEPGELWVKGPTTFAGYWRRPELTARAYDGAWMRTGDLVRIVDGRLYHDGRLDDLIKLGGVWVSPVEIEDVLRAHPDVREAAVVALDDDAGLPILKAFITSERDDGTLARELVRACKGRLATYKIPRAVEVVTELPRTPTGKLKRFVLRNGEGASGRPKI